MQGTKTPSCPCGSGRPHLDCHGSKNSRAHRFDQADCQRLGVTLMAYCQTPSFDHENRNFADQLMARNPDTLGELMGQQEYMPEISLVMLEHFALDHILASGQTAADELAAQRHPLSKGQKRALHAFRHSHLAAYEITGIHRSGIVSLRDCATDAVLRTRSLAGTEHNLHGRVLGRFLPDRNNTWRASLKTMRIPNHLRHRVDEIIAKGFTTAPTDKTPAQIYQSLWVDMFSVWLQALFETTFRLHANHDGETLEQAELVYEVEDPNALHRELDAQNELERADHYRTGPARVWRWPRPEQQLRNCSLGCLVLNNKELRFEAISRARIERMRRWLDQHIETPLRLRTRIITTESDLLEYIESHREADGTLPDSIFPRLQHELIANLRRSLDEPNPCFDFLCVREAAAKPELRDTMIEWLRGLPKVFIDLPDGHTIDDSEVWHELGFGEELERQRAAN